MAKRRTQSPRSGSLRTQRQLRVGELLRHILVEILGRGELRDPDLVGASVTVTEVRVSPDLRNAAVFVMPLGGNRTEEVVVALSRATPYLRRMIGQSVTMKYNPALSFMADKAFDEGSKIETILSSPTVSRDLRPSNDDYPDREDQDESPRNGA
ncbi:MAG: 30S ribosome-binding factor RbfA [Proteobacteria bacterium]|nr:30S ribosome-binding factor RbfA [Pseudomonadota bacterium]MDA1323244.1 30S ribosome-binding factor RbfA [Pseudomonadota bacterium]